MKTIAYIMITTLSTSIGYSQEILENYVEYGIKNNEIIQQQNINLEKSIYALKEAKSLFAPTVTLHSTYTLARGGRTIDFPVGDIVNPVYNTLNQLTNTTNFQNINNVSELLNPNNFYDVNFRTMLPLINTEIIYNKRIKEEGVKLQEIEIEIYKRELIKDIKIAYYEYLMANEGVKIMESALSLVEESNRVNKALFDNNKINRTTVIRSESELTKRKTAHEIARLQKKSAQQYFNFLINKDLDESIEIEELQEIPLVQFETSIINKEELQKLEKSDDIYTNAIKLAKSYLYPKLNVFMDVGSQGFDFDFDSKTQYVFGGISMEWNIFSGNKNKHKLKQVELEKQELKVQTEMAERQLALQLRRAENNFLEKSNNYLAAVAQSYSAKKYHSDVWKLYKEGQVLYLELIDAQNELINAQVLLNINRFDLWTAKVEIERASTTP